ncbi:MAG: copper homeostasis protein CutC [Pedobacter sp.]|nr:MAG: copper homeostasis protein CutC [Pedobacter sp.]
MVNMEVCANSLASALAAQEGGAIRVELCDNLLEGGTTPSYAQIALARRLLSIKLYPIIRPRGGDFLYTDLEFELMKEDISVCKDLNCDGVVIGILKADGSVDVDRCSELVELARPMQVTFHRAFDMSSDLFLALEAIISIGCERILTSGGEGSAITGAVVLAKLIEQANERITIMPGAGITSANIAELIKITGAVEFHASARSPAASRMLFKNQKLSMGAAADEFTHDTTNPDKVRELIAIANRPA